MYLNRRRRRKESLSVGVFRTVVLIVDTVNEEKILQIEHKRVNNPI